MLLIMITIWHTNCYIRWVKLLRQLLYKELMLEINFQGLIGLILVILQSFQSLRLFLFLMNHYKIIKTLSEIRYIMALCKSEDIYSIREWLCRMIHYKLYSILIIFHYSIVSLLLYLMRLWYNLLSISNSCIKCILRMGWLVCLVI